MWCSEKLIKKWNLQGIVGASFDTGMAQIIVSYVVSFILMRVYPAFVSVDNKPWVWLYQDILHEMHHEYEKSERKIQFHIQQFLVKCEMHE